MQGLSRLMIAFCLACICAELVSLLTDTGWTRRCIKAVAGLYILVVFLSSTGVISSERLKLENPELKPTDLVSKSESFVLANAAQELEETLAEQCLQRYGTPIRLGVDLQTDEGGEVSARAEVVFPPDTGGAVRGRVLDWLETELGEVPVWREGELT